MKDKELVQHIVKHLEPDAEGETSKNILILLDEYLYHKKKMEQAIGKIRQIVSEVGLDNKPTTPTQIPVSPTTKLIDLNFKDSTHILMHEYGIRNLGDILRFPKEYWKSRILYYKPTAKSEIENKMHELGYEHFKVDQVNEEDDVKCLGLGDRICKILHGNGIHTVKDVLNYPNDAWYDIKRLNAEHRIIIQEKMHEFGYTKFKISYNF